MEDILPILFAVFFVIVMIVRGIASLGKQGQQQGEGEGSQTEEDVVLSDFANRAREMLYGEPETPAARPPEFDEFSEAEPTVVPNLQDLRATLVDQARRLVEPEVPVALRAPVAPAAKRRAVPVAAKRKKAVAPTTPVVTKAPPRRRRRTGKCDRVFANLDDIRRGIVLSEILRPPKAFR